MDNIPPPPPGFILEGAGSPPPPPQGFSQAQPQARPQPQGRMDAASLMPALIQQESGGRAGVLGPMTQYGQAIGRTQMLPATAREMAGRLGIPYDESLLRGTSPEAAAYQDRLGQAYLQEGLDRTGNVRDALRYYHGGPDRSLWGPKTNAYADQVMGRVGQDYAPQPQQQAQAEPPPPPPGFQIETGQTQQPKGEPGSSQDNPIDLTGPLYAADVERLRNQTGLWVNTGDRVFQTTGNAYNDNPRPSDQQVGARTYVRDPNNFQDNATGFFTAASEQTPFADEASALANAAMQGRSYSDVRNQQIDQRALANQTNRGSRVAGGLAGFGLGLAAPGATWLRGANGLGQAALRTGALGAGYGAAYGAGNTDGGLQDRARGAGVGAVAGGLFGAATPAVAEGVRAALPRVASGVSEAGARLQRGVGIQPGESAISPRHTASAIDYVRELANNSGADLANAAMTGMGKPITAAEALGPTGVSQMAALTRRSGRTAIEAQRQLGVRAADRQNRIVGDYAQMTGTDPASAAETIAQIARQGRQAAAPLYEAAYAAPLTTSPRLNALLQRPSVRAALSQAARIAAEEGRDPASIGIIEGQGGAILQNPTMQTMDYVKRGLDDVIERYRDPTTRRLSLDTEGRAVVDTASDLRRELIDLNPAYGDALKAGGDPIRLEQAFNSASDLFSTRINERTFASRIEGMGPAERNAVLAGLGDSLRTQAQNNQLRTATVTTPAFRSKLSALIGEGPADQFIQRAQAEISLAQTGARMAPNSNSVTAEALAAMAEQDQPVGLFSDFARNLEGSPTGGPVSAAMKTAAEALAAPVAGFARGVQAPGGQAFRDEVGRLLMLPPQDLASILARQPVRNRNYGLFGAGGAAGQAGAMTARQ